MPLLAIAFSFPTVVYTVLIGVALLYWVFVLSGLAQLDLLGAGDGALEGAADGAAKGLLEGAAEGLDGAAKGAMEGAMEGVDGAAKGALSGLFGALKLRAAPATVVLSLLALFSWLFSVLGMQAAYAVLPDAVTWLVSVVVFVAAPLLALPATSVLVRPLGRLFVQRNFATARQELIGKVCTIRTGTVTDRFGEASLEDGGSGLVVRVRVDGGERLARGDQALIVAYDEERQEFTIAPMKELLSERVGDVETGARARLGEAGADAEDEEEPSGAEDARGARRG